MIRGGAQKIPSINLRGNEDPMLTKSKLSSKVICITGANRGIGLGLTTQLLKGGHQVYATTRSLARSQELVNLKEKFPDQLSILELDVSDAKSMDHLASHFTSKSLDVLINNAGILLPDRSTQGQIHWQNIQDSFIVNTMGPMGVTEALRPAIKRAKSPIVLSISSQLGSISENNSGDHNGYRMSKAALNMWNRSFAAENKEITAVVLHPGWVKTDMGGEKAPTSIEESCRGIIKVLEGLEPAHTGQFLDFCGKKISW